MALKNRSSAAQTSLSRRHQKLQSIDPKYDLGSGLTAAAVQKQLDALRGTLSDYNQALNSANGLSAQLDGQEKDARDVNRRLLKAVEARYGADSEQYQQAGGKRLSTIKRARGVKAALRAEEQRQQSRTPAPSKSAPDAGAGSNGTTATPPAAIATAKAAPNGASNGTHA